MIEFLQHILDFRLIDLSLPIIASLALYVAYRQLKDIRKHQMIEFTYQLYRDFFNYLNDEKNKKQKDWLFGLAPSDIDEVKIGDLLEKFEALWSLQSKGLIDDDIAYDLFSYYVLKASVATAPSASEYISRLKREDRECLREYTDDLYVGYNSLVKQMGSRKTELLEKAGSVTRLRVKN